MNPDSTRAATAAATIPATINRRCRSWVVAASQPRIVRGTVARCGVGGATWIVRFRRNGAEGTAGFEAAIAPRRTAIGAARSRT
jgi:hypothetical protein